MPSSALIRKAANTIEARISRQERFFQDTVQGLRPGQKLPAKTAEPLKGKKRLGTVGTDFAIQVALEQIKAKFGSIDLLQPWQEIHLLFLKT